VNIIVFRNSCRKNDNFVIFLNKFLESRLPALHTFENIIFTKRQSALCFFVFILEFDKLRGVLKMNGVNPLISVLFFRNNKGVLKY